MILVLKRLNWKEELGQRNEWTIIEDDGLRDRIQPGVFTMKLNWE